MQAVCERPAKARRLRVVCVVMDWVLIAGERAEGLKISRADSLAFALKALPNYKIIEIELILHVAIFCQIERTPPQRRIMRCVCGITQERARGVLYRHYATLNTFLAIDAKIAKGSTKWHGCIRVRIGCFLEGEERS
jgi:hypothetical protein